jgi:hypothetical protein
MTPIITLWSSASCSLKASGRASWIAVNVAPMEGALSKAKRIWELLEAGKKPSEIAVLVNCRPEYVRVVRQRRLNPERAQVLDSAYKHRRYHADAEYRERAKARSRGRKSLPP